MLKSAKAVAFQFFSLGLGALVLLIVSRIYPLEQLVGWMRLHVAQYQPWSTLGYPLVHAACNLLLLPAGVLVVGSGFLFGLWQGFLLALIGHLLGATGAFWISRTFGRRFIERHLATRPQWRELDRAIEREGWKIVFLSQLSPLFPTSLFNYCYGLTCLRYWPCMFWIALGWSPGMFLYAYLGRLGHFGWKIWREGSRPSHGQYAVWIGGLIVSVAVTIALGQIASRLLREARERASEDLPEMPVPEVLAASDSVR
jgi:uncharacterized membrane protein YdjX (TVP38/TMEM64 family)